MKIIATLFVILFALQTLAEINPSDTAQTLYQKGIKAFQEQKFTEAQQSFSKAFQKDQANKFILHNWALAEFQLENRGMAIAAWRRALFLDPSFTTASKALKWALSQLPNSASLSDASFWEKLRTDVLTKVSLNQTLAATFILFLLSISLLIKFLAKRYHALKNETPLPKFPTPTVVLTALLMLSLFVSTSKVIDSFDTRATIIAKNINMKTGPSPDDSSLFELLEGSEVIVLRTSDSWSQVTYPGGFTGWIPNESLFLTSGKNL